MTSIHKTTLVQLGSILLMVPFLGAAADSRSYSSARFALDIPGVGSSYVKSFEGGNALFSPITRGARADKYPDKSPGAVRYEDAVVSLALPQTRGFWDWANAFSSPSAMPPKTLTLSTYDANYAEKSRRVFEESVISVIELPTFDSGSKDPGFVKVSLAVGRARENAGTAGAKSNVSNAGQPKSWSPGNFRLTIEGVDTNRVSKIDAITIKRSPKGPLEYSNLVVTIADQDSDTWKAWVTQSIDGKPSEKNGRLELLGANLKDVILTINLEGLGIVRLAPEIAEANSSQLPRDKVELYVEKITFAVPPG